MDIDDGSDNSLSTDIECRVYDAADFRSSFCTADKFLVFHQNVRSFNKNSDELILFLVNLKTDIDVLILTETWFNQFNYHDIPGFNSYHSFRTERTGGGVSVYVIDRLKSSMISDLTLNSPIGEFCSVNIKLTSVSSVNVVGYYRPPEGSVDEFCEYFENFILSRFSPGQQIVAGGDANINLFNNDRSTDLYMDIMFSHSLLPCITLPTRVTNVSQSLIDHFWCGVVSGVRSGIFKTDITDHYTTFVCVFDRKSSDDLICKKFRDCSKECLDKFRETFSSRLLNFNIMYSELDIDLKTKIFLKLFWESYEKCCPIKIKYISRARLEKPWFDDDLKRLCDMKHDLFKRYKANEVSFDDYNYFKNQFSSLIKRTRQNYFRDKFERSKSDIRATWRNINNVMGCKRRSGIDRLVHDNITYENDSDISRIFNKYFASVAGDLRRNIPDCNVSPVSFMKNRVVEDMSFNFATVSEVNNIISSLKNKSCRLNSIPVYVFKSVSDFISPVICDLFNESVQQGTFPDVLKTAECIPIFKKGCITAVSNYRPISLLPNLSKIMEKLMRSRLVNFFEQFNILSEQQFGFRTGRDTSDAILEFLDYAYSALDSRNHLVAICIDMSRAFDTLDHSILLSKLEHVGVRGVVRDWLRSFLSNRKQFVTVNNASSTLEPMSTGVPQGSVLGPLLFLLYIDDMAESAERLKFVHFADDTTVFSSGSDMLSLVGSVNREFMKVDEWLIANKLSLNLAKTTFMIFTHSIIPRNLTMNIRDQVIKRVDVTKFLGVLIDDKLTFRHHISDISSKLSRSVGVIYRMSQIVPVETMLSLYYSLFHSNLTYAISTWGGAAAIHLNRLSSLQNRVVKMLPHVNSVDNYHSNNILKLIDIYKYFISVKFYKCYNLGYHSLFVNRILNLIPSHSYSTRHSSLSQLNLPICHKSRSQKSFIFAATKNWNSIPVSIKNSNSLNSFKSQYKKYLLSKYL